MKFDSSQCHAKTKFNNCFIFFNQSAKENTSLSLEADFELDMYDNPCQLHMLLDIDCMFLTNCKSIS